MMTIRDGDDHDHRTGAEAHPVEGGPGMAIQEVEVAEYLDGSMRRCPVGLLVV